MTYTSVSTKYQVVIPKEVRERIDIKPGQKFIVWEKAGIIYLIPVLKFKAMEGYFKGMNIEGYREEEDRV
ncbi:MAG: AbrB/MazE/SpoVT family DNA-binding domain-containing protein [Deltaproteobacteria bacterium]|nr:AbrB/MazE/SpoVT family DNA-binding domain-containing protein [Deltaproteobacteria bacterium]